MSKICDCGNYYYNGMYEDAHYDTDHRGQDEIFGLFGLSPKRIGFVFYDYRTFKLWPGMNSLRARIRWYLTFGSLRLRYRLWRLGRR